MPCYHVFTILHNELLAEFGIKICRIIPKFRAIQKHDYARLSVTNFVTSLKPNIFYGTNFKRWRNKKILQLIAMHVIHVRLGKPDQFSPEAKPSLKLELQQWLCNFL
jgi:hypothetical protein